MHYQIIKRIVELTSQHGGSALSYLELLKALVKVGVTSVQFVVALSYRFGSASDMYVGQACFCYCIDDRLKKWICR